MVDIHKATVSLGRGCPRSYGLPGAAEEVGYNLPVAKVDGSVWRRPVMKLCSLIIDESRFLSWQRLNCAKVAVCSTAS